jgi:DnaJ-class molecular chaperone
MGEPIFDWPIDKPVHEAVGEAIGAASACWSNLEGAGEFDSSRASDIVEELLALLRAKLWTESAAAVVEGERSANRPICHVCDGAGSFGSGHDLTEIEVCSACKGSGLAAVVEGER